MCADYISNKNHVHHDTPVKLDRSVSVDFQATLAAAFYWKAQETSEGPEKLAEDILGASLKKLVAVATGMEVEETIKDSVGNNVSYGKGFRSDQILDIIIFLYGGIMDRSSMNAAQDRAAYRRRKNGHVNPGHLTSSQLFDIYSYDENIPKRKLRTTDGINVLDVEKAEQMKALQLSNTSLTLKDFKVLDRYLAEKFIEYGNQSEDIWGFIRFLVGKSNEDDSKTNSVFGSIKNPEHLKIDNS